MDLLPVFTFVLQHFLTARVQNVVVFNCWDINSQFQFLRNANYHLFRTQMVDMGKDFEFPGRYLDGRLTVLGVFLDLNCSGSSEILNKASDMQLFIARNNWLIIDWDNNSSKLRERFEHSMMSIDAQITHAFINKTSSNESDVTFILSDIYNNGKFLGGKLNITLDKMMTCNATSCKKKYLTELSLKSKYGNRCNLNDTTFRLATVVTGMSVTSPSEVLMDFLTSMNNSHLDTISRYGFKLIVILQEILNYKVNYFYVGVWSYNETAGGSIGAVWSGEAELSSSPLIITQRRLKLITPLLEIGAVRLIFLFRTPHNEGLYGDVFLSPFSVPVWVVFGVVLILFAVLFWVIFAIEARIIKFIMFIPSILSTFLISFGVACVQSATLIPSTIGGRIAFVSLSMITFIMYNYYTSVIVSSLVGSPVKSRIKTVTQLADSSLNVGMEPVAHTITYLNYSNSSGVKRFIKKKLFGKLSNDSPVWMEAEEGIIKAKDRGFAYHTDASTAYWLVEKHFMQHEICDLNEVKLRRAKSLYIAVKKKSPFEEIIRLSFFRMLERGLISKYRRFWMRTKLQCISNNVLINVGLEYTGPLFVFLAITYIFALIVLVLEIAHHKFALRRRLSLK